MKIDCIKIADLIYDDLKNRIEKLYRKNIVPHLVILKNNSNIESQKYVDIKIKKANELNIKVSIISNFNSDDELIEIIKKLNASTDVHGYIIQLPLPNNFDKQKIFKNIDFKKDIDGLGQESIFYNYHNIKKWYPNACTAKGIMEIFKYTNINLESKNVVIINRSEIVGKPLMLLLLTHNATVTMCHSKTKDLSVITKNADIIISGVGIPNFIKHNMINNNCILIDVGINVVEGKIVGDLSECAINKAKLYTTVPNGVGRLTVAMLFLNLISLIELNN